MLRGIEPPLLGRWRSLPLRTADYDQMHEGIP